MCCVFVLITNLNIIVKVPQSLFLHRLHELQEEAIQEPIEPILFIIFNSKAGLVFLTNTERPI